MVWVCECFFWYRLTWVVQDKIQRAVKLLCVCVCMCRRRKTLIQNRGWRSPLASPYDGRTHQSSWIFPAIGFWVCFVGDVGRQGATSSHVKNLTAQTWRSTHGWSLGIDPTASTAMHSSFIEVPSTSLQVCMCVMYCLGEIPKFRGTGHHAGFFFKVRHRCSHWTAHPSLQ